MVWHTETELPEKLDLVALPGGFSFGDYLRSGAIAARSPAMLAVHRFVARGGYVLGICNGFQVLCEADLLPGAFLRNSSLKFVCRDTWLRVEDTSSFYTCCYQEGQVIRVPVAHADGAYALPPEEGQKLAEEGRIAFRYVSQKGAQDAAANPNGSHDNIAGILSANRRILGLMPHPERVADPLLGGNDGATLFRSLVASLA